jgi:hypothetical protein
MQQRVLLLFLLTLTVCLAGENPKTTASLVADGAKALSTQELQQLVVGKTLRIIDLRTNNRYDVYFGEDGTRTVISTVETVSAGESTRTTSRFEVKDGQLFTVMPSGATFSSKVFELRGRHFGARNDEEGYANYELMGVIEGRVTVSSLMARGAVTLSTEELTTLLVGKTLTIRHLVTGEIFEISYSKEGRRLLAPTSEHGEEIDSAYKVRSGRLEIHEGDFRFSAQVFRLKGQLFGARSIEDGFVSYEILSSR